MIERKKLRNDLILILSLLLVAALTILIILSVKKNDNLIAKVYVKDEVVKVIDLTKKEDREFKVQGTKGEAKIRVYNGSIAVIESNCPHQDCVHMGYISDTTRPIICAYNQVSVVIEGATSFDVDV